MNIQYPTLILILVIGIFNLGLGITNDFTLQSLGRTLSEMNNRQKSVVVTQHKAIEDKITEVCNR